MVWLTDVDESAVTRAADEFSAEGLAVRGMRLDVTDIDAINQVVRNADAETPLRTVVNNAGIGWSTPLVEVTPERFDSLMAVNLRGAFFVLQAAARVMIAHGEGSVINIASTSAFTASTIAMVPYDTSKGAIRMLTVSAAHELAALGIRVNAIAPGTVATDLTRALVASPQLLDQQAEELIPLGRLGSPEDMAAAVDFLSSEAASYVTGHVLVVDGGWLT